MAAPAFYAQRRKRYLELMGPRAVALLRSPPELLRNGDSHYSFRQSSDVHYLTGFDEPETTLVLGGAPSDASLVMFVRPRDPEKEVWNGRRAGVDGAIANFGAQVAFPNTELGAELKKLIANVDDLYCQLGEDPELDELVLSTIAELRRSERVGLCAPKRIIDPRWSLHEMRLRKSDDELDVLQRAADITCEAHAAAMKAARPGMFEYELEALVDYTFRRRGGTGPGYTTIVGTGANATILHYIENNAPLANGDLVLIDAGCELDCYTADVTRTFPVSGSFSPAQKRCYQVVLDAQKQAIEMTRPGATIDEIHDLCVRVLTEGMISLGLLEGSVEDRIADRSYRRFYMHRTSHWLGMDVHDVGSYSQDGKPRPLEPGMVLTIEPGLYIASDAQGVAEEMRGIGIRIEDDVVVTADGHRVLTHRVPKEIHEVEALCRS